MQKVLRAYTEKALNPQALNAARCSGKSVRRIADCLETATEMAQERRSRLKGRFEQAKG
jgi:Cdc6-like AAA superfamily ATPase